MTTHEKDARDAAASRPRGNSLLPIFLKIAGRPCLVVGAGQTALKKLEALMECGAQIQVVAYHAIDAVRALAQQRAIHLSIRRYVSEDLSGIFLVVAATNDSEVNQAIFRDAKRRGVLINAVDAPPQCDFYFPAIVRRGRLQVVISTSGESPAFAQKLKEDIDFALPESLGAWLERLGKLRRTVLETVPPCDARTQLLAALANRRDFTSPQPVRTGAEPARDDEHRVTLANARVAEAGTVYFIDAAFDDPHLLTLRAASLLATADVIVHDESVPVAMLDMRDPNALLINSTQSDSTSGRLALSSSSHLISSARAGHRVVRLFAVHSGSFDTRNEEIAGLRAHEVPFEIVPGVSGRHILSPDQCSIISESIAAR